MSRGRKLLVTGLAAVALAIATSGERSVHAQQSSNPSLSERISALGNVFKRKKSTSNSSSNRSTHRRTSSTANGDSRSTASSEGVISGLIPDGWFGRNKSSADSNSRRAQEDGLRELPPDLPPFIVEAQNQRAAQAKSQVQAQPKVKVTPQVTVGARAGSAALSPQASTRARKSPSTQRQENLDETLSDLLANEEVISTPEEGEVQAVAADKPRPLAAPPIVEEPMATAAKQVAKVSQKRARSVDLNDTLAAVTADLVSNQDESTPDEDASAEHIAASEPATVVSAKAKPVAESRLDVHDALLSGEIYDELIEAEEEAELSAEQLVEEAYLESGEFEQPAQRVEEFAASSRPARALPNPRAEERVAEVTSLPFESMDEPSLLSEPRIQSTQRELRAQPDQQRDSFVRQDRIRSEAMPIAKSRKPADDVLTSTEQPVIVSHVEGPRNILVGREASYRVILENTSNIAAQNLSAAIQVPEWADLVDVVSTSGEVGRSSADLDSSALEWRLPELAARSSQTLRLRLIPRSGREFQLGVQWTQESAATETRVTVQEPKLEMSIHGPQEVLYGAPQRFRLTLYNPGTGPAERVAVSLIPPGKDSTSAATHAVGTLGPEEVKEIEMELTARDAGELILQASATAAGGLEADAIKRVLCRKPELEIDWRGPDQKFSGTESSYYFRVRNTGTAATDPVEVKVRLPEGIQFLSASDSYSVDAQTGVVTWRLSSLAAGEEQFMQVRCRLDRPGTQEFDITARTVNGDLRDSKSIRTEVVALADLKLNISDPQGARPVGEAVVYEIRVENRGTTDAHGVSIVGLFSEGIDPVSVEGAQNSVRDGRVTFMPVNSLPAGGEVLLRIRAVASQVGTHVFRAEVACEDLDLKLAAEETTRFFQDEFHWKEGETPYTAERSRETLAR